MTVTCSLRDLKQWVVRGVSNALFFIVTWIFFVFKSITMQMMDE